MKLTLSSTVEATVKTLTGLSLVKSDDSTLKVALTCSATTAVEIEEAGSSEFSCTAATLSTAGTYKLTGSNVAGTDTSNGALTIPLNVKGTPNTNPNDEGSSKFLSYLHYLFYSYFFNIIYVF